MAGKLTANSRLQQDYLYFKKNPVQFIDAEPLPSNILEWHYVLKGPENSPYYRGYYHGRLLFSFEYPFKPPSIYMITPNGRFKTNTRLCLSISDFHPDTWNPTWSVATLLIGLLSFMLESKSTFGSIVSTIYEKRRYAQNSLRFNLKNPVFCKLFPNIVDEIREFILLEQKCNNMNSSINNIYDNQQQNLKRKIDRSNISQTDMKKNNENLTAIIPINNIIESNRVDDQFNNHSSKINFDWQSVCSYMIIIPSFVIFVQIANYILENLSQE